MIKYLVIFLLIFTSVGYTHSGRTDKNGGHTNRKTGEYHYHNKKSSSYDMNMNNNKSPQNNSNKNNENCNQKTIKNNSQN